MLVMNLLNALRSLSTKAVLGQWQIELREKFNLNWPIYDGSKLAWYPSPAWRGRNERDAGREDWHREPAVIASSQLMRRSDRAVELLERAESWDLVVLDEAHHARRRGAGSQRDGGPNALLKLMQGLKDRTRGLVLLTATPMQVHPMEVWDLLDLLGLPPEWTSRALLDFFDDIEQPSPSAAALERMASLFRSAERAYGELETPEAQRATGLSRLKANKVLRALRDAASIPRRQLETAERRAAIDIMRAGTPMRRLVSRNTRELLRRYFRAGMLTTPIAERQVEDRFLEMTDEERGIYDAVTDSDLAMPERPPSTVTMEDLDRVVASSGLMAPGIEVQRMGRREYGLLAPGMIESLRVTTDPEYYEEHAESLELWSPGNPLFVAPEFIATVEETVSDKTLKDILDGG